MAKIFFYIFNLFAVTSLLPDSISKQELTRLKKECIHLYKEKKYSDSIPAIEKYLSFRDEIPFKIYLAKSILFRKDLPQPNEEDEIFLRQEKFLVLLKNYKKASKIFSEVIPDMERITPKDKTIGELYFLWAFSESFSENKEKAISLFKKSSLLNPELKSMAYYNVAALYEDLGQTKESQIYFNKQYEKN